MILTKREFDLILKEKSGLGSSLKVDFGERKVHFLREKDKVTFKEEEGEITLDLKSKVKDNFCYLLDREGLTKIAFFDTKTNHFYKLTPTPDWPTISIGSVPMHKLSSPKNDCENKIKLLKPKGLILDTCMGLGYTAILASHTAKALITFEKDENVISLAKINPVSKDLFSSPKIKIRKEDVAEAIKKFNNNHFDCIIHDPPTFKLAPQLYSKEFYRELLRTLKFKGGLFHYTPLYKVKRGFNFPQRIAEKLKAVGFKVLKYSESAGGLLCRK